MKIEFKGAAQTVTGSQTWIEHYNYHCMIDCGLFQGPKELRQLNWEKPEHIEQIKAMIISHAHIDHTGLIPRYFHWGWKGNVYCTEATAELLKVMLMDAARLQEEDAKYANFSKHSHHDPALPLYTEIDAERALKYLHPLPYDQWQELSPYMSFRFLRAGHILGSASIQISYTDQNQSKILTFSGDLGSAKSDILKEATPNLETHTLVLESTYGDRKLDSTGREQHLAEIVNKVFARNGTIVIPAFALGRTQDILLSLYRLQKNKQIPNIPIYLDSPMANSVTKIYNMFPEELKISANATDIENALSKDFFTPIESPDMSMLLCMSEEPKIVISASGMLQGGRVLHHLKHKLPDPKNAVIFVGFQAKDSKGRLLQEGISSLRIHHKEVSVEAEIFHLSAYSAHADQEQILNYVKNFNIKPNQIFLNHGEIEAQQVLAKKILEENNIPVCIAEANQIYTLD